MQYLVSIKLKPGSIRLTKRGPKQTAGVRLKSRTKMLAELRIAVNKIKRRYPAVNVLTLSPSFAVIETDEKTATNIKEQSDCNIAPNRSLHMREKPQS